MSETRTTNNGWRRAVLIAGCAAALTLVAALLGPADPAQAAATLCASSPTSGSATVGISPCSGLTDGGTVTITGTGFTPSQSVAIFMCNSAPTNTDDCDFDGSHQGTATADTSGNLSATFTVHSSFTTGNGPPAITCNNGSPSPNCTVLAVSSVSTFSPGAFMGVGFGAAATTSTTSGSTTTTTGSSTTSTPASAGTVTTTLPPSATAASVTATPTFSG